MKARLLGPWFGLLCSLAQTAHAQNVVRAPAASAPASHAAAASAAAPPAGTAEAPAAAATTTPAADAAASSSATQAASEGAPASAEAASAEAVTAEPAAAEPAPAKAKAVKPARVIDKSEPPPPPKPEPDPNTQPFTHHQTNWAFSAGLHTSWIPSSSLDPFATRDAMAGILLRVGVYPWAVGRFSLGFAGDWVTMASSSSARSSSTNLHLHHFGLGLEGRFHLNHRFAVYARVSPGALGTIATLDNSAASFSGTNWSFRLDSSLGATMRVAGNSDGSAQGVRLLLYVEGGYEYAATQRLSLSSTGDVPRAEPVDLGTFDGSGPHAGGGLILTY
jgi:hypothetical protein